MKMLKSHEWAPGTNIGVAMVAVASSAKTVDHDRSRKL